MLIGFLPAEFFVVQGDECAIQKTARVRSRKRKSGKRNMPKLLKRRRR
jgi:hypothetical protein